MAASTEWRVESIHENLSIRRNQFQQGGLCIPTASHQEAHFSLLMLRHTAEAVGSITKDEALYLTLLLFLAEVLTYRLSTSVRNLI